MTEQKQHTLYAPAERVKDEILQKQEAEFSSGIFLKMIVDSIPHVLVILNQQRQIVFANKRLFEICNVDSLEEIKLYGDSIVQSAELVIKKRNL